MRISLLRISLLRFFKTFQKYLPNAILGLNISLLRFSLCLLAQKLHKENRSNEIISPKIALGKNLANAKFG